jgi:hypothetical protein
MPAPSTPELVALAEGGPWWSLYLAEHAGQLLTEDGRRWLAELLEPDGEGCRPNGEER